MSAVGKERNDDDAKPSPLLAPIAVVGVLYLGAAILVRPLLPIAYRTEPETLLGIVTTLLWVGVAAAPAVTFVKSLVLGATAWATLTVLGAEARFRGVLSAILIGECVLGAQGLFVAVMLRLRGADALGAPEDLFVPTGLDAWILGKGPVLEALARGVTPFHAAWICFLVLALAKAAGTSRPRAAAAALTVWALTIGTGLLRAVLA